MQYKTLKSLFYEGETAYLQAYKERNNPAFAYILNFDIEESHTFVVCATELVALLYDVQKLDKKLTETVNAMSDVSYKNYVRSCLLKEVVATNEIEGDVITEKEVADALANPAAGGKRKRFEGIAKKYEMLLNEPDKTLALASCADIRKLYDELILAEMAPSKRPDGEIFRKEISVVNSPNQKELHRGLYPEEKVVLYMERALAVLKEPKLPPLIRIAVLHYFIGYIHPFYDGNGRLSRYITSYLLAHELSPLAAYRFAYTVLHNHNSYYTAFDVCNDKKNLGDLTPFVLMFLEMLKLSLAGLLEKLETKGQALEYFQKKIYHTGNLSELSLYHKNLIFYFVQNQIYAKEPFDIVELAGLSDKSAATVKKDIETLREIGIPIRQERQGKKCVYSLDLDAFSDFLQPVW